MGRPGGRNGWDVLIEDEQTGGKLGGEVEADGSYIGGKARNMHGSKRARLNVKAPLRARPL